MRVAPPSSRSVVSRRRAGSAFALDVPQSLEHELEIRRLDPSAFGGGILGAASARGSELDPTCLDGVEDLIHELVVRDYRVCLAGKLVVPLDRPEDRPLGGLTIQPVQPKRVAEEVRDLRLERVELRESVLANADQEVGAMFPVADDLGELLEGAATLVVEEVLLELVEDDVELGADRGVPPRHCLGERAPTEVQVDVRPDAPCLLLDRAKQAFARVAAPVGVHDDPGGLVPSEPCDDAGAEKRRLPHAARPVQDRESRGHEVGGDHLDLALAAEEEQRVELGLPERRQALERRRRRGESRVRQPVAPAVSTPACAARASIHRSRGRSSTSTPCLRQNSSSNG